MPKRPAGRQTPKAKDPMAHMESRKELANRVKKTLLEPGNELTPSDILREVLPRGLDRAAFSRAYNVVYRQHRFDPDVKAFYCRATKRVQ